jgi:hypothetical protein
MRISLIALMLMSLGEMAALVCIYLVSAATLAGMEEAVPRFFHSMGALIVAVANIWIFSEAVRGMNERGNNRRKEDPTC